MIVYLAVIEFALVLVQPPAILAPFPSVSSCLLEAERQNTAQAAELVAAGAAFVCLEAKEVRS